MVMNDHDERWQRNDDRFVVVVASYRFRGNRWLFGLITKRGVTLRSDRYIAVKARLGFDKTNINNCVAESHYLTVSILEFRIVL